MLMYGVLYVVTRETRHLDRLGQLGEYGQDSNTDSEQESDSMYGVCFHSQHAVMIR